MLDNEKILYVADLEKGISFLADCIDSYVEEYPSESEMLRHSLYNKLEILEKELRNILY